ncbi:hypothetical protein Cfor_06102 [Coptotermes formosanus]|uniref:Protein takeout n=1 Tax=Coptotermes formosanus TaxID=36987 RepID=A0A6L2PUU3_COPFO|nr:hypothetical protein Cfor_06102 [Coptotermes formosanus]
MLQEMRARRRISAPGIAKRSPDQQTSSIVQSTVQRLSCWGRAALKTKALRPFQTSENTKPGTQRRTPDARNPLLAAYIQKCSIQDPNINTCALNSAKAALPHLVKGNRKIKMPVMDPMFLPELRIADSSVESSIHNSTVTGLKDLMLEKLSFDFEKKEVEFESVQPYLNFTGTYKLSGKLASLPVFGNGPYNTSLFNLTIRYKASYELQKLDDAEVYMIFKDYDCDIIPQDVMCRLGNLFNGNKLLGEAMNTFLKENWRLIYKDVGKTMSMAVGGVLFSIFKESAKTVPYKDIFSDVE